MDAEQFEMMHTLLGQMKHSDRDILRRFYLEEQTQERICLEMKLTQTQFRLHKSRAKARFSSLALEQMNPRRGRSRAPSKFSPLGAQPRNPPAEVNRN
jgi:hypothetical protein